MHNGLSVLYVCITKSSAKHVLLGVPSWTQNSHSLDSSPPSKFAQMSVCFLQKGNLLRSLIQPLLVQDDEPTLCFFFWVLSFYFIPSSSCLRAFWKFTSRRCSSGHRLCQEWNSTTQMAYLKVSVSLSKDFGWHVVKFYRPTTENKRWLQMYLPLHFFIILWRKRSKGHPWTSFLLCQWFSSLSSFLKFWFAL